MDELLELRLANLRVRCQFAALAAEVKEWRFAPSTSANSAAASAELDAWTREFERRLRPVNSTDDIRSNLAQLRYQLALIRFELLQRKAGFNPNQPRAPKNNPGGGQWSRGAGPGIGHNQPPVDDPPPVPKEKPSTTKGINAVAKDLAKWARRTGAIAAVMTAIEGVIWLHEQRAAIRTYAEPAKTLKELHDAVSSPASGTDVHHIVEQKSAEDAKYPDSMIHGRENLVRISRMRHWEINGWYGRHNKEFQGLSPREYLRDKDWATRHEVGLKALREHGVLKP